MRQKEAAIATPGAANCATRHIFCCGEAFGMKTVMRQPTRGALTFDFSGTSRRAQTLILACILFWSVLAYLGVTRFVFLPVEVSGVSMSPTLLNGERRLVHRWMYRLREPRRGDIVAIDLPSYDDLSVKRIVARPYEKVQIKNHRVYVNEEVLDEPYLSSQVPTWSGPLRNRAFRIAPDCYFVLGDNRPDSIDSRTFGAVHRRTIIGPLNP